MRADVQQDSRLDDVDRKALEARIWMLRHEGKTYSEIGRLEGITPSRARYLFQAAGRSGGKRPSWTDGLNDRLANSLHWLGFKDRQDVSEALASGHLRTLARFERGLRGQAMSELAQWLGLDHEGPGTTLRSPDKIAKF